MTTLKVVKVRMPDSAGLDGMKKSGKKWYLLRSWKKSAPAAHKYAKALEKKNKSVRIVRSPNFFGKDDAFLIYEEVK